LDKIWYFDSERNDDADDKIEVETSRIIQIWRTFVFPNRK